MLARKTRTAWKTMMAATTRADTGSSQVAEGTKSSTTAAATTAKRGQGVAGHVQQGRPHVEVVGPVAEDQGGQPVDHQPERGHHHHHAGPDLLGMAEAGGRCRSRSAR